jgi:hypothetical protein
MTTCVSHVPRFLELAETPTLKLYVNHQHLLTWQRVRVTPLEGVRIDSFFNVHGTGSTRLLIADDFLDL